MMDFICKLLGIKRKVKYVKGVMKFKDGLYVLTDHCIAKFTDKQLELIRSRL